MKTNKRPKPIILRTHEGSRAERETNIALLERVVATCLLFEDTFYEGANSIAKNIETLCTKVNAEDLIGLALHAKENLHLRHVPLFLAVQLTKNFQGRAVGDVIERLITRPDDMTELLSLYWKQKRTPLSKQMKRGLALAFKKFDEYQLAKYNRDHEIKLRDVLFMVHAKPGHDDVTTREIHVRKPNYSRNTVFRHPLFTKLVNGTLAIPETWETLLSEGVDKKTAWEWLLEHGKLPSFALLKNLRNMDLAKVNRDLVLNAMEKMRVDFILPYQFISAYRYAPAFAMAIEEAMLRATETLPKIKGSTLLIVDVSGSMDGQLAGKSQLNRLDAACGLALHIVNTCRDVRLVTFSNEVVEVPVQRGFGLIEAISKSQRHGNTYLRQTIDKLRPRMKEFDRVIVLTDEQSHDGIADAGLEKQYLINVAPNQYGVDTQNRWKRINGFSTAVVDFIVREEETPLVWKDRE